LGTYFDNIWTRTFAETAMRRKYSTPKETCKKIKSTCDSMESVDFYQDDLFLFGYPQRPTRNQTILRGATEHAIFL
jgi:hypothetical protein